MCWYVSRHGRSIRGHCAQQRKSHLQCGNAYFYNVYAHIVAIAMSYSFWNICLPCGMTVFLYVSYKLLDISPDLLFCTLQLWYLRIFQKRSCNDNNDEFMFFMGMQYSHPHMTFYRELICFGWGGRIFRNVESLMIIFLSLYLFLFIPTSSGGLTILLWISHTETYNDTVGITFFLFVSTET